MAGLPLASTSLRMRAPSSRLRRSNSACAACALRQALPIRARVTPRRPARPASNSAICIRGLSEKSTTGVSSRDASTPCTASAERSMLGNDCTYGQK